MSRYILSRLTFWRIMLLGVLSVGLYAILMRLTHGLGATTGLSDQSPWGIWIGFDVLCGVALAAGGFTVAGIVYVFHLERFRPILRPAILTAFLGYIMAVASLILDLGRPDRIWHPVIMWNDHSVMFEVAWCVMLYTTILALEFSPVVLEKFKMKRLLKIAHIVTPVLVIVGVLLSTLHQSSLGTLFVIMPNKVYGLWYTPFLPVLFYISAIGAGLAMTIFESTLSHRAFGVSLHKDILASMGKAIAITLSIYLVAKIATLAVRGDLGLIFARSTESYLYILEMVMGVLLPIILFSIPRVRANRHGLFYSSLLVVLGVVLNRLNVSITGMARYNGNAYFPSVLEVATTVFIIACGFIVFGLIARYLPVFSISRGEDDEEVAPLKEMLSPTGSELRTRIATPAGIVFLVLLASAIIGMGYRIRTLDKSVDPSGVSPIPVISMGVRVVYADNSAHPVDLLSAPVVGKARQTAYTGKSTQLRLPDDYVFPKAEDSPGTVVFSHRRHIKTQANACAQCHPKPYRMASIDAATDETQYGKMVGCGFCHNGKRAFDTASSCEICHTKASGQSVIASIRRLPEALNDFKMPSASSGFGKVVFSHRVHVQGHQMLCGKCHPKPYRMKRTALAAGGDDRVDTAMAGGHKCDQCHDGGNGSRNKDNCGLCHGTSVASSGDSPVGY